MDFEDMERKIVETTSTPPSSVLPTTPAGAFGSGGKWSGPWSCSKSTRSMWFRTKIWSDIILEGHKHIPVQSVSEYARNHTVALYAPSKTFNLAGLVGAYHIIYDRKIRERMEKESSLCHYNDINILSMYALLGAYQPEGYIWADELRQVITGNVEYACDYIAQHFDGVEVSKPEGTYMLFADCSKWCEKHGKTLDEVEQAAWDVGVAIQDGRMFHAPATCASTWPCPLSRVKEAFGRLDQYVFNP